MGNPRPYAQHGSIRDLCRARIFSGIESAGRSGGQTVRPVGMSPIGKIPAVLRFFGKLLRRIPFREVWFSVALLLVVGENYPFSDFPMYSSLEDESVYFVVRTGQDETLAYATSFRSRASFVPKALKTERRKLEKSGMSSEAALGQAGRNILLYLLERAEPQKREGLLQNGLKLVEIRISVDDSRLKEEEKVLAEIAPR